MIIVVYVDDLIMCRSPDKTDSFATNLKKVFDLKGVGDLKRCLGMDFKRDHEKISVSQGTYISVISSIASTWLITIPYRPQWRLVPN